MKRLSILLLISVFAMAKTNAQYKSVFGQNSTQWIFETHNLMGGAQDTIFVQKDTTAYGYNWKKIQAKSFNQQFKGALIREDTTIGKVWYKGLYVRNSILDTMNFPLYDFSLNVNDTFNVSNMWSGYNGTTVLQNTVDSIYYIGGYKCIRFKGKYGSFGFENYTFIEGIGGNLGVLWKQYSGPLQAQYLLCSYKDGVQTFYRNKRHNGNCDVFNNSSSINGIEASSNLVAIYPNPSTDVLNIDIKNNAYQVLSTQIIDVLGRVAATSLNTEELDVSKLPRGTYCLKIKLSNDVQINKRFQKN